jgi:hypothetical protein
MTKYYFFLRLIIFSIPTTESTWTRQMSSIHFFVHCFGLRAKMLK